MIMMTTALSTSLLLFIFIVSVTSIALDIRYPQFFHQSLNDSAVEITEGKSPGSFIAFVNLINSSQIIPNEWSLNLTETDFKIQSNALSYSLITTQTLDRERRDLYDFSIYARHLVPPYETISKPIRIRILDLNDCTPTFNQTIYHTTIIPNQSTFMITAHDDDEPQTENSRISYALSNYQDLFRINETTGVIECIKDPNTNERYELIVVARDHGKPSLTSSTLVQVQLVSPRAFLTNSSAWLQSEQKLFIFAGILAAVFVCVSLSICTLCWLKYRMRKRQEKKSLTTTTLHHPLNSILSQKKFSSSASSTSSTDLQQQTASGQFTRLTDDHQFERAAILYDAMNVFPNTYYLPLKQQSEFIENINNSNNNDLSMHLAPSSSTTSSPVSGNGIATKAGSDDGCYCSSDMSSEQSNNHLLLNASSLTSATPKFSSKHVRFTDNHTDGALKRFENLYGTPTASNHCASYV